jgi:hypothetical protein
MNIFILEEYGEEGAFFVGAFSTEEKANERIEWIINKRFEGREEPMETWYYQKADSRDSFVITEYEIDKEFIIRETE